MVTVDESTGNKYMRMVEHKGLEGEGDTSWLVKDMHQELKSWGYPGGSRNALILKGDGEPAIIAVREALARCHGGRVTPEEPPAGEHQSNGAAEEAGKGALTLTVQLNDLDRLPAEWKEIFRAAGVKRCDLENADTRHFIVQALHEELEKEGSVAASAPSQGANATSEGPPAAASAPSHGADRGPPASPRASESARAMASSDNIEAAAAATAAGAASATPARRH